MIYTYEIKKMGGENGQEFVYRVEDGAWIPTDPANPDYQRYLAWLENPNAEEIKMLENFETINSERLMRDQVVAAELAAEEAEKSKLAADIAQATEDMRLKISLTTPTEQTQQGEE
jgi:hypothetical protein